MTTQDGPQYLIHMLFLFFIKSNIDHAELTVIMSLVVSTIAVGISIFNIVMCTPNEFDPIILQLEFQRRQEIVSMQNQKLDKMKENFKKKMQENTQTVITRTITQNLADKFRNSADKHRNSLIVEQLGNRRISNAA